MVNKEAWERLQREFAPKGITLVAVSKIKPASDIQEMYDLGQRDFGENYVQELVGKQQVLPADIRWHFIGHLQSNKVKEIISFVHLIHAVDSFKLFAEINKQSGKINKVTDVLLQMHIANEETKFGMDAQELDAFVIQYNAQKDSLQHIRIRGLMGMASFTEDKGQVRQEFARLHESFAHLKSAAFSGLSDFDTCSMGMSGDYEIAIAEGSNMVRIGSMLFGSRH